MAGDRRRADFAGDLALPDDKWRWCDMCESEVLIGSAHTCHDAKAARARRAAM